MQEVKCVDYGLLRWPLIFPGQFVALLKQFPQKLQKRFLVVGLVRFQHLDIWKKVCGFQTVECVLYFGAWIPFFRFAQCFFHVSLVPP